MATAKQSLPLLCALLILSINGCAPKTPSAKMQFFQKHPDEKAYYTEFSETSIEIGERLINRGYLTGTSALDVMRTALREGKSLDDAYEGAKRGLRAASDYDLKFFKVIEQDFDPNLDGLFFYTYKDNKGQEQGWAVVREGQIRKKYPVTTGTEPIPE